ncbi:MAG: methyltransferase domain-containing protein [Burkholderiales bacterium]|nr:methyltransferase domain-containing protein [Burkholderiales bacterium]
MDDVSRMVARQYEAYAYPAPFTDLAAQIAEGYFEFGNPADYAALLWPEGRPRRPLSILAAGCGTVQAAYLAHTNRDSEVIGVDLSEASLAHERFLQERHGLANLRLFRGDLREVHELGRRFDCIVCSGVLHHLADPDAGLRALAGVLAPQGAMTLMLYGATARTGVYMLQDALRRLRVPQSAEGVAFARRLVEQLPDDHFARWYLRGAAELRDDAAFVDTFLHPQDRAYTVPQVLDFLERNGLAFGGWVDNAHYYADAALARFTPEVRGAVAALPAREQWAVVEMLTQNLGMHMLAARHAGEGTPAPEPDFASPGWQSLVPRRVPGLRRAEAGGRAGSAGVASIADNPRASSAAPAVAFSRSGQTIELGPGQAALLEAADGSRRIADLLALPALAQVPAAAREPLTREFLAQMWRLGHLLFARGAA